MSMQSRPILLVVHDDNTVLRQIAKMVSEVAELMAARGAGSAMGILNSDQSLNAAIIGRAGDGVAPIKILRALRHKRPNVRSMLLADSGDLSVSVEALHDGVVDHVMNVPLRERELLTILSLPMPRLGVPRGLIDSVSQSV